MALIIENEEHVLLRGYIDEKGNLQFIYGDDIELFAYGDSIEVARVDKATIELRDPDGKDLTATHREGSTIVNWGSVPNGVIHTFLPTMTEPVEVEVTPHKIIFIQTTPTGGL